MNEVIKFTIELIAIIMIWIAVDYKRPDEYKLIPNEKGWWFQLILIATALTIVKTLCKY